MTAGHALSRAHLRAAKAAAAAAELPPRQWPSLFRGSVVSHLSVCEIQINPENSLLRCHVQMLGSLDSRLSYAPSNFTLEPGKRAG